jgi:hypothetical protein
VRFLQSKPQLRLITSGSSASFLMERISPIFFKVEKTCPASFKISKKHIGNWLF